MYLIADSLLKQRKNNLPGGFYTMPKAGRVLDMPWLPIGMSSRCAKLALFFVPPADNSDYNFHRA
jgi:hypothetical protein